MLLEMVMTQPGFPTRVLCAGSPHPLGTDSLTAFGQIQVLGTFPGPFECKHWGAIHHLGKNKRPVPNSETILRPLPREKLVLSELVHSVSR